MDSPTPGSTYWLSTVWYRCKVDFMTYLFTRIVWFWPKWNTGKFYLKMKIIQFSTGTRFYLVKMQQSTVCHEYGEVWASSLNLYLDKWFSETCATGQVSKYDNAVITLNTFLFLYKVLIDPIISSWIKHRETSDESRSNDYVIYRCNIYICCHLYKVLLVQMLVIIIITLYCP